MPRDKIVELYRAYGGAIYNRCRRLLDDAQAAEDATQETFVRVQRHLARAPDGAEALRWIYRIATNYCLNELRNRKPQVPVEALELLTPGDSPADRLVDRQAARAIILRLPEKLAVVAWLYHVDGLEQAEIAHVLGLSRRTVVYRLSAFVDEARRILAPSPAREHAITPATGPAPATGETAGGRNRATSSGVRPKT